MRGVVDGVRILRLRHWKVGSRGNVFRALSEISFGLRVVASAWNDADVVVCISPALLSSAMTVARILRGRRGRPAVGLVVQDLYFVGLEETRGRTAASRALRWLESWTARNCDGLAVIHGRFKERVVTDLSIDPDVVSVIRNWTHVTEPGPFDRRAFRTRYGWSEKTVVLHAGAMGDKQGLENVVQAAKVADARRLDVHFVLMGDGKERQALEMSARGLPNVEFLNPLPEEQYGQAMRAADILLVNEKPGVIEMAVPSKLTSYFSTGMPILAATEATSTSAGELAASGAGLRVPPGAPEALALAAHSLGIDRVGASSMGANGPRYCAKILSEQRAIDLYDSWVHRLVARSEFQRGEQ